MYIAFLKTNTVAYDYTSNAIVCPLPYREASTIVFTFQSICNMLEIKNHKPQLCALENEASTTIKDFFIKESIDYYQLFPPKDQVCHNHSLYLHVTLPP